MPVMMNELSIIRAGETACLLESKLGLVPAPRIDKSLSFLYLRAVSYYDINSFDIDAIIDN